MSVSLRLHKFLWWGKSGGEKFGWRANAKMNPAPGTINGIIRFGPLRTTGDGQIPDLCVNPEKCLWELRGDWLNIFNVSRVRRDEYLLTRGSTVYESFLSQHRR